MSNDVVYRKDGEICVDGPDMKEPVCVSNNALMAMFVVGLIIGAVVLFLTSFFYLYLSNRFFLKSILSAKQVAWLAIGAMLIQMVLHLIVVYSRKAMRPRVASK